MPNRSLPKYRVRWGRDAESFRARWYVQHAANARIAAEAFLERLDAKGSPALPSHVMVEVRCPSDEVLRFHGYAGIEWQCIEARKWGAATFKPKSDDDS